MCLKETKIPKAGTGIVIICPMGPGACREMCMAAMGRAPGMRSSTQLPHLTPQRSPTDKPIFPGKETLLLQDTNSSARPWGAGLHVASELSQGPRGLEVHIFGETGNKPELAFLAQSSALQFHNCLNRERGRMLAALPSQAPKGETKAQGDEMAPRRQADSKSSRAELQAPRSWARAEGLSGAQRSSSYVIPVTELCPQ